MGGSTVSNEPHFEDEDGIRGWCSCGSYIHWWKPKEYPARIECKDCEKVIEVNIDANHV